MAGGGNFLGRVISYVVNQVLVEGLANNHSFQRFAVKTNKAMKDLFAKVAETKEMFSNNIKDTDSFKRQ